MIANKGKKVLFFIEGIKPTDEEFAAAKNVGTLMFRNSLVAANSRLEKADGVSGLMPAKDIKQDLADRLKSLFDRYRRAHVQVLDSSPKQVSAPDKK